MGQQSRCLISPRERSSPGSTAFLGLGSNLGDRFAALRGALTALDNCSTIEVNWSAGIASLYETSPSGVSDRQPDYLNSVVGVVTTLEPKRLLDTILSIEIQLGRERPAPGAARVIDIDLLLMESIVLSEPLLTLPHPRLHQRRFVMEPLCEIAPDVIHPKLLVTISALSTKLRAAQSEDHVARVAGPEWHCTGAASAGPISSGRTRST